MKEPLQDLQDIDLAELNLDPTTYELVQRLLNCIETLVADLNEAQAEIQRLRDEIARLKELHKQAITAASLAEFEQVLET